MPATSKSKPRTQTRRQPAAGRASKRAAKPAKAHAGPGKLWLHPKLQALPFNLPGPFIKLPNNALMTPSRYGTQTSRDNGKTWTDKPLFNYGQHDKELKISNERVLLRTRDNTLILSFMNYNEKVWGWDNATNDSVPNARIPHYVVRSIDGGQTWQTPTMLHEDWTGEIRNIIQLRSGRLVLSSMKLLHNPGRHSVLTYVSGDDGVTWRPSPIIDLGGVGHHGGVTEAPIIELNDGRVWMLLRTNWGRFWQAFSQDGGLNWRHITPTNIDASSAPGLVTRLASGRIILVWNRLFPEGKTSFPMTGGDNQWSEVPVSNHREELSIAFSDDDARNFSKPIVIARQKNAWLSYPRIYEHKPGELWLTTMQGGLCLKLLEKDFA